MNILVSVISENGTPLRARICESNHFDLNLAVTIAMSQVFDELRQDGLKPSSWAVSGNKVTIWCEDEILTPQELNPFL